MSGSTGKASRMPPVLQQIRVARRDTAASELRRLQDRCAAAEDAQSSARAALHSARGLRADLLSGRGPAAGGSLRLAALPSCDALVSRAQEQLTLADNQAQQANAALQLQRQALQACERALMRSEAWAQQQQQAEQVQQHRAEQDMDDELAARFRSALPATSAGAA
ncbi:MAG: hypothetical protein LH480_03185 [Rubrivivax sp.]|nr:hypothetical protein [Rubrivivax sp.]